ncbi:MAG TPA: caspase family protein [Paludibacteraceae bacterium]|nr:caspase family protein [Paludibacteraceae bacterium]HQF50339.1 caspase family protein [Paludibacteraceae bacterium]
MADPGVIGFYSSTESQKSNESEQWDNGIFTKALIEGLSGNAKDADGNITIDELERYIREAVRKATNGKQMPIFENKQGNFVLFEASK